MFSESLTVRILGDSSGLRREIDNAISQVDRLEDRLGAAVNSSNRLGQSLRTISGALGPLRQLVNVLTQVNQQLTSISRRPIALNVSPAISALQRLTQAAQMAAAAISSIMGGIIRGFPPIPPGVGPGGGNTSKTGPRVGFASGGLVAGPTGIDRVDARLTSGEYVINREAVSRYGISYLDQLNQQSAQLLTSPAYSVTQLAEPSQQNQTWSSLETLDQSRQLALTNQQSRSTTSSSTFAQHRSLASQESQTTQRTENHFGGITVNMQSNADLDSFFRDLRSQGISLRYRRG